tara:strand:+ start:189 stop:578 length:390 start_codon:yes stop_codon:yes gene_type:complete
MFHFLNCRILAEAINPVNGIRFHPRGMLYNDGMAVKTKTPKFTKIALTKYIKEYSLNVCIFILYESLKKIQSTCPTINKDTNAKAIVLLFRNNPRTVLIRFVIGFGSEEFSLIITYMKKNVTIIMIKSN